MALGPILPGRLPGTLLARRLQSNLQQAQRLLTHLQEQATTGQKFFIPSESPAAAVRTITLQKALERNAQFQSNVVTDRSFLNATEQALSRVGDALNHAAGLALAGIGDSTTDQEKVALAAEAQALLRDVFNVANTKFRGRYLFGGSQSQQLPFEDSNGLIRYVGDTHSINSFVDLHLLMANNVDGNTAFGAITPAAGSDVDPALTLQTQLADLYGGLGVDLGPISVTLDNGGVPQTATVDLTGAETIGDIQTRLEDAFSGGPLTLTVAINATSNGLQLTPSAGTVAVADIAGARVARDLGIASTAAAQIDGGDLNPALTLQTQLADFNGGTGIGPTAGNGLLITSGKQTVAVDISAAVTVEDLFNTLRAANLDLELGISESGDALSIASRLSGGTFAIGENNGTNAAGLGIRTFGASTPLSQLNFGNGVPVDAGTPLSITRRDGTTVDVNLAGTTTVQSVLDAINAVDPGNLVASINTVGNGISLTDNSGAGPLTVAGNPIGEALGLNGTEAGPDNTVPLVGSDVNQSEAPGVLGILANLHQALADGNDQELERLSAAINSEISRISEVRGEVGTRLQTIDRVEGRLLDSELRINEDLSLEFDADLAEVITQVASRQQAYEATLKITASSFQLTLLNFL